MDVRSRDYQNFLLVKKLVSFVPGWIGNQILLTSYGAALASALRKNKMQIVTLVQ